MNWAPFFDHHTWQFLWRGLQTTIFVSIVASILSLVTGVLLALGRLSRPRLVRMPAILYIETMRALPVFLMIIFVFFALPKLGMQVPVAWAVIFALTLYNSSVVAEIVRAGILSIEKGQTEAARSLGFGYAQTMRFIILPQALQRMIPPLVAQFITLLKDTSLGVVIGMTELLRTGEILYRGVYKGKLSNNPLETLFVVAMIYFLLCYSLSLVSNRLERRGAAAPR
jgi:His/Glu/Gln/Arg/opine family amino acid ABC transporter permease subunit